MKANALVTELQNRGVEFRVCGDNLLVDAPKGVVQPADVAVLQSQKTEIIVLLAGTEPPYEPCATCGGRLFWAEAKEDPDHAHWHCDCCEPPPADLMRHACALPLQDLG